MAKQRTFSIQGMLEGQLPGQAGLTERIRRSVDSLRASGIDLVLDVDLPNFSVVPRSIAPLDWRDESKDPRLILRDGLNDLLLALPEDARRGAFSTIRSTLTIDGEVTNSVYALGREGLIDTESRAAVVPPPVPTGKTRARLVVGVAALVLVTVTTSWLVLDDSRPLQRLIGISGWPQPAAIQVETRDLAPWVSARCVEVEFDRIAVEVVRMESFPRTTKDLDQLVASTSTEPDLPNARTALHAVFAGRLSATPRYDDARVQQHFPIHVPPAWEGERARVWIPIRPGRFPDAVVLSW